MSITPTVAATEFMLDLRAHTTGSPAERASVIMLRAKSSQADLVTMDPVICKRDDLNSEAHFCRLSESQIDGEVPEETLDLRLSRNMQPLRRLSSGLCMLDKR